MTLDIDKLRRETPGVENRIHFNNAGAALIPLPVYDAVKDHLDLELAIGGYESQARAEAAFERTYDAIAELINCDRSEIALVENATVGWQMAFYGLSFKPGDRILTAEAEYATNVIDYLQIAKRTGVKIDFVPSDNSGQMDVNALEKMIDDRVKLISATHIPTNGGLINPAAEIGAVARRHGIPYLLDACQAVGQIPVDVETIGCDMLSVTGRKYLRGPRGTGFLYVRKGFMDKLEPPFLDMHGAEWTSVDGYEMRADARRFENWEFNVAAVIGLGAAVDYLLALGIEETSARLCALAATAREKLSALPKITVQDIGEKKGGIVTFEHEDMPADAVKAALAGKNINVSITSLSSTRFDLEKRGIDEMIRASFHYYNTEEEIDRLIEVLREL
ncbi:aminotransferase class V-fold PLP-dependent enzyme [Sneathiella chungangensis]|uniref:Aminotransferase class V-fold PLP-dependent enzyme n=1 Tax=Sneathiella chungangensis TaxID=1418234 RepID=A0A845MEI5_9PROT|nr:aminotransferase class V-fold PLP-dependent enzyme [Sneathiella chungangensis]MZR22111.1 aminotransferase class V-fold PLP-dependent enzyme [Sneathiella chungangensis]